MGLGGTVVRREELITLDVLRAPVWIFDLDHAVKWWANLAAVTLWGAASRDALLIRNSAQVMSEATRTRLAVYRRSFERGETAQERHGRRPTCPPARLSGRTGSGFLSFAGCGQVFGLTSTPT